MLHDFITTHRDELIRRCQQKVAIRLGSPMFPAATQRGVPVFLTQLVAILQAHHAAPIAQQSEANDTPAASSLSAAASHGTELLRLGYTVDQVVHEYGDVCQSITELAVEWKLEISADEFRTLNLCLDEAIADAVASFGLGRHIQMKDRTDDLQARLEAFMGEQARLVETATQAFSAIRTGGVGTNGATGQLLGHALTELRYLTERTLPQIQSAFERTVRPAQTVGSTSTNR